MLIGKMIRKSGEVRMWNRLVVAYWKALSGE
jgi:hypothetical protein